MSNLRSPVTLLGKLWVESPEEARELVLHTLYENEGRTALSAEALSVHRQFLWWLLRRMGLEHEPARIRAEIAGRFRLPAA